MTMTQFSLLLVSIWLTGSPNYSAQLFSPRLHVVALDGPSSKVTLESSEQGKGEEEVLTPLTDEERSLVPRDMITQQPDFVGDLSFFVNEGFGGFGGAERIARKGNRFRDESEHWIFVGEIGRTTARLYPRTKVYDEMQPPRVTAGDNSLLGLKLLGLDQDIVFTALGTVQVDGHQCVKIRATRKGDSGNLYLYAARDLDNLVITVRIIYPKKSVIQRLRNTSLEVPDALVEIPAEFKAIEHDRWTKLEAAKVIYKDKPSQDFGVFRAPGGELFIWVNDAYYPWHYLVRPQKATVEIAFQGLLVNRSGEYIWRTKETEAFSQTSYRTFFGPTVDTGITVTSNSVKFRSNNYDKDYAMIEASW